MMGGALRHFFSLNLSGIENRIVDDQYLHGRSALPMTGLEAW